jgi:drug/metabolite transporter (DMT)-like permease
MARLGIMLAISVALCWGVADTSATFASRRLGSFLTTCISLVVSVILLLLFGIAAYASLSLSFSTTALEQSILPGLLTGIMAAIGYFSLYRGLELGPLALVSPIVAADGAVAALLALVLLHEHLSGWQLALLGIIFVGIVIASMDLREVRLLMHTTGLTGVVEAKGTRWALVATLAFGLMLFGIGLGAGRWGWYLPILWTRIFAMLALLLIAASQKLRHRKTRQPLAFPQSKNSRTILFSFGLASTVGLLESIGLLVYSLDTRLAMTGIAAAISSSFGLIPLIAGMTIFHERPTFQQLLGICLVIIGLFLLSIKPV